MLEEIEVNLILPPDEELRTVNLPVNGAVQDTLIAAEHVDSTLIVSDHFAHTDENETELSNYTSLSKLPEPRDLWNCRRLNISHFPVLCQSSISDLDSLTSLPLSQPPTCPLISHLSPSQCEFLFSRNCHLHTLAVDQ
jgi:hypothetical protein